MKKISVLSLICMLFLFHGVKANGIYSKEELKGEKLEIKNINKLLKKWQSALKSNNWDYINTTWQGLYSQMLAEANETSTRVGNRQKNISQTKAQSKSTSEESDLPKGYNPTIDGQINNMSKNDIERAKTEHNALAPYQNIITKQNSILRRMKNFKEFNSETADSSVDQLRTDVKEFIQLLNDELLLMKKEKKD